MNVHETADPIINEVIGMHECTLMTVASPDLERIRRLRETRNELIHNLVATDPLLRAVQEEMQETVSNPVADIGNLGLLKLRRFWTLREHAQIQRVLEICFAEERPHYEALRKLSSAGSV